MQLFTPLLSGANLRDRIMACLGAFAGIALTALLCSMMRADLGAVLLLSGPFGASAVLLFAIPASPMAQPWPVVGGSMISAAIGVTAAQTIGTMPLAAGVAVAIAVLVMSMLRCLHAPGGAAALIAVVGGPAVTAEGYYFVLVPIGLNAAILVAVAWGFHRLSGHSYPHRPPPPVTSPQGLMREDVDSALAELGETFDISHEDLDLLLQRAAAHADERHASMSKGAAGGR